MLTLSYMPGNVKPKKDGVYPTRVQTSFSADPEHEIVYRDGFSWWDNMRQRWGAQRFTADMARKEANTAALRYNVDQTKEWKEA